MLPAENQVKNLRTLQFGGDCVEFWDAYYLEKIQEMKAQRKAELEEAGKL